MFATSSAFVTSALTKMPPIWAATFSPDTGSRSAITTFAPSSAKRIAVALPMPLEPPVITATRSCKRFTYFLLSVHA